MCTVTLIPRRTGYRLAMNRDERLSRVAGLPPKPYYLHGCSAIFPSEPNGGTWIALNEHGIALSLINWYSIPSKSRLSPNSRGEVVRRTCQARTFEQVAAILHDLPLLQMNPFRLIGVFPADSAAREWRWDQNRLTTHIQPWQPQQWISSGFDEAQAQRVRSETFRRQLHSESAGGMTWLRNLHRSHKPMKGPFSTCMHREDAATVSYTEIEVSADQGTMRYVAGPGCCESEPTEHSLSLVMPPVRSG
jgi:hypothetical protein